MNCWHRRFLFQGKHNYHVYLGKGFSGTVATHSHEFSHVMYVIRGKVLETQYGQELIQNAGECFFTPAGVEHGLYVHDDTEYYCLSFSQNIEDILFSHLPNLRRDFGNLPPIIKVPPEMQPRLNHCFCSLMDEQNFDPSSDLHTAYFLVVTALIMMLREEYQTSLRPAPVIFEKEELSQAEIARCIQHINANYDHPLNVDTLARISTLSRSAFCKAFQAHTGKTVKQYLVDVRIKEAMRLISLGNLSLQTIAQQVGYNDFSTFYRNFVQITGTSPAQYRTNANISRE